MMVAIRICQGNEQVFKWSVTVLNTKYKRYGDVWCPTSVQARREKSNDDRNKEEDAEVVVKCTRVGKP
jgi:hypothetical protein